MMTCEHDSPFGFKRIGFMSTVGSIFAALACNTCAIAISLFSFVVYEFKDIFCDLNGATLYPLFVYILQSAATIKLFPALDAVP